MKQEKPRTSEARKPEKTASNSRPLRPRNVDRRPREFLSVREVKRLAAAAHRGNYGLRDFVLITIAYRHALKVKELTRLEWEQVNFRHARLYVNKIDGVPAAHHLEPDELEWLRQLKKQFPGSGYVFPSERGGPVSERHLRTIVARAGEEAGFDFPIHPLMLRISKAFALARRGENISAIQGFIGLKSIQNTILFEPMIDPKAYKNFVKD
jgi:integrase